VVQPWFGCSYALRWNRSSVDIPCYSKVALPKKENPGDGKDEIANKSNEQGREGKRSEGKERSRGGGTKDEGVGWLEEGRTTGKRTGKFQESGVWQKPATLLLRMEVSLSFVRCRCQFRSVGLHEERKTLPAHNITNSPTTPMTRAELEPGHTSYMQHLFLASIMSMMISVADEHQKIE